MNITANLNRSFLIEGRYGIELLSAYTFDKLDEIYPLYPKNMHIEILKNPETSYKKIEIFATNAKGENVLLVSFTYDGIHYEVDSHSELFNEIFPHRKISINSNDENSNNISFNLVASHSELSIRIKHKDRDLIRIYKIPNC